MKRLLLLVFIASLPCVSFSQNYPNRAVRMIVPFAPGGTTDGLGRVVAHFLRPTATPSCSARPRPSA
jgi:tripartite-type tricarboxylate transporter receptor subunit TctC